MAAKLNFFDELPKKHLFVLLLFTLFAILLTLLFNSTIYTYSEKLEEK